MKKANDFDDLQGEMTANNIKALSSVYKSVDDIDLYVGILTEKPLAGTLVRMRDLKKTTIGVTARANWSIHYCRHVLRIEEGRSVLLWESSARYKRLHCWLGIYWTKHVGFRRARRDKKVNSREIVLHDKWWHGASSGKRLSYVSLKADFEESCSYLQKFTAGPMWQSSFSQHPTVPSCSWQLI